MTMQLSGIYRYPVKSARGHEVNSATMDRFGLAGDRRWMLIDSAGQFYSQRRAPAMALLGVAPREHGLRLTFGEHCMDVDQPDAQSPEVSATVWEHTLRARCAAAEVNAWLRERLGEDLRLVFCPENATRSVDAAYLPESLEKQHVAFSDGFPLLIISQASLDALNARLPVPVPMDRFRPNLLIAGAVPHAEDQWKRLRIGATELAIVKPCSRCVIPSINQQTAEKDPLINRVLAEYRRRDGVIYFGMNAIATAGDRLTVGDSVSVLD
ncbi:MOSC domain-containing protein [Congregibacter litoralis]|uniref:Putative Fe-S protein n=1 Tax=Congregibacter litoralis KT71 TaxID=314285 RepID=A4AC47_9GAMM|nr:MOSC N-terminal beta barrel domain-containing protein [Congregibacter litoralis]EAQ96497.1 putative Fe-S protein [Congregibacter litoralis KT71]